MKKIKLHNQLLDDIDEDGGLLEHLIKHDGPDESDFGELTEKVQRFYNLYNEISDSILDER